MKWIPTMLHAVYGMAWSMTKDSWRYARYISNQHKPRYLYKLAHYPYRSSIFILIDKITLSYFQRWKSVCLQRDESYPSSVISFCYNCEVGVLYAKNNNLSKAMQRARAIPLAGAREAIVLLKDNMIRWRESHGKT